MSDSMIKVDGALELIKLMDKTLPDSVQRKILRQAITAATTPIVRAARKNAPVRFGWLKKSMGRRIRTYKENHTVVAIVGPRKDIVGRWGAQTILPRKYAHLVEFGHAGKHAAPAHPFLRPAWDSTKAQAVDAMTRKMGIAIEREAAKLRGAA